ncbi:hypothetical protein KCN56_06460 [Photobacterium galatheae]|uniref:hypothetical protein n=1 Tax=Photobacterium galatheae TaxID=1654360 RepID=UPI00202CDD7D|nr:hypothetical protein [Photobacterium galatheae]MCM0148215.1 hypothetical protein [Photobacterium galatheae]
MIEGSGITGRRGYPFAKSFDLRDVMKNPVRACISYTKLSMKNRYILVYNQQITVIPAQAGIHWARDASDLPDSFCPSFSASFFLKSHWIPAFAGMTEGSGDNRMARLPFCQVF